MIAKKVKPLLNNALTACSSKRIEEQAYAAIISSPIGHLGIKLEDQILIGIDFFPPDVACFQPISAAAEHICNELKSYFENPLHIFNVKLHTRGTVFQTRLWQTLQDLPIAQTTSYKMLADQLQTSPRAIGNACRANPIPIIIPCHRVVAINHVGGYSGETSGSMIDIKNWLLEHEKSNLSA